MESQTFLTRHSLGFYCFFAVCVGGGGAGRPVYGRRDGTGNDVTRLAFPLNG